MKAAPQFELPVAGDVFNLASEQGVDIDRVLREQREQLAREVERREYEAKMQATFEQCPGFVGGDVPASPDGRGVVVVEPGRIIEALAWLKRRFHANETIDISTELQGICVEVAPRVRRSPISGQRIKVRFGKPEQFTLALD